MCREKIEGFKLYLFKLQSGYSLIELMLAVSIMSVMSLGMAQLMKNSSEVQSITTAQWEAEQLRASIQMIINNQNHCEASFKGATFRKKEIDFDSQLVADNTNFDTNSEGLDVTLHWSNPDGSLGHKKFNGADNLNSDPDLSDYAKLQIDTIKLVLNSDVSDLNCFGGENYCEGIIKDPGQLVVGYHQSGSNISKKLIFDLDVMIETDNTGVSQITTCANELLSGLGHLKVIDPRPLYISTNNLSAPGIEDVGFVFERDDANGQWDTIQMNFLPDNVSHIHIRARCAQATSYVIPGDQYMGNPFSVANHKQVLVANYLCDALNNSSEVKDMLVPVSSSKEIKIWVRANETNYTTSIWLLGYQASE